MSTALCFHQPSLSSPQSCERLRPLQTLWRLEACDSNAATENALHRATKESWLFRDAIFIQRLQREMNKMELQRSSRQSGKKGEEMAQRRRVKSRGQDWTSWEVWSRQLQRKDPKGWRRLWQALNLCRLSCSTTVSQYGWAWKYRSYQYRSMATEKRDKDAQRERKLTENTTS